MRKILSYILFVLMFAAYGYAAIYGQSTPEIYGLSDYEIYGVDHTAEGSLGEGNGDIYYLRVDGTNADPDCSESSPCCAGAMDVSDHNAASFSPGDTIYICGAAGDIVDNIVIPSSGSSGDGNCIYYDGYYQNNTAFANRSESSGRAVINLTGTYNANEGTTDGYAIYGNDKDYIVIQDLEFTDSAHAVFVLGSNYYYLYRLYVHENEQGVSFDDGAGQGYSSYVTVDDCVFKNIGTIGSNDEDLALNKTNNVKVTNSRFYAPNTDWGIDGIVATGSTTYTHSILIENNIFGGHNRLTGDGANGENAVDFKVGAQNVVIWKNHFYNYNNTSDYGWPINMNDAGDEFIIAFNKIETSRVGVIVNSDNTTNDDVYIVGNIFADNIFMGISNPGDGTGDWYIYNNTFARNGTTTSTEKSYYQAAYIDTNQDTELKNNIFYRSQPNKAATYHYYLSTKTDDNVTSDYNIYWPHDAGTGDDIVFWGDASYRILSELNNGSSNGLPQDTHSSEEDPDLTNPSSGNFTIAGTGSGAYGEGEDLGTGALKTITVQGVSCTLNYGDILGTGTVFSQGSLPVVEIENFDTIGRWDIGAYAYEE
jgi:hypothetical protein